LRVESLFGNNSLIVSKELAGLGASRKEEVDEEREDYGGKSFDQKENLPRGDVRMNIRDSESDETAT
jgi:hypothetical protein